MREVGQIVAQAEQAFTRQEWREAAALYSQVDFDAKSSIRDRLNYFYCLEHSGQVDAAKAGYIELSCRNPLRADAHIEAGLFFQRQGQNLEAAAFFGRALCIDPHDDAALQGLDMLDISARSDIDHCCIMGGLAGTDTRPRTPLLSMLLVWPMVTRAMAAMRQSNWQQAELWFLKILKISPDNVPMLVQLGHCLREQEHYEKALVTYRRAILQTPRDPDIYLHLGHTLKSMERYLSALDAYTTALTLQPALLNAQVEIKTLERFLHSRGIKKMASNAPEQRRSEPSPHIAIALEPGMSDRQSIIFRQLSNAISLRD